MAGRDNIHRLGRLIMNQVELVVHKSTRPGMQSGRESWQQCGAASGVERLVREGIWEAVFVRARRHWGTSN